MQNPQALPLRVVQLETEEVEPLAAAQRERGREYVRMRPGGFRGALREWSDGTIALANERWSSALRVRCARPQSYVVFSVVRCDAPALWCGLPLGRSSVIEVQHDWEITTHGALEACSFAVERARLEAVEALLDGTAREPRRENRLLTSVGVLAGRLREQILSELSAPSLPPAARRALVDGLLQLAAALRRAAAPATARVERWSRRRAAVRLVEEYLDAHEHELPSLAELCAAGATSERTLEYAFREQLDTSPLRYVRLRRLNAARRELRAAEPGTTSVTAVALRWGFWQPGRFAGEYRKLFGERPSETLRCATKRCASIHQRPAFSPPA